MEKFCLECGDKLRGRADKKYCDDSCRNAFNNKQYRKLNNYKRNVNGILSRNRRILAELSWGEITEVSKMILHAKGFDFNYYTNTFRNKSGRVFFCCYDMGYSSKDNDQNALVIKTDLEI